MPAVVTTEAPISTSPERRLRASSPGEALPPSAISRDELLAARLNLAKVVPYQRSTTPFISNLSLSVLAGLLLVFAFPDWNLWTLAWIAPAPLIMAAAREQRFWSSFLLGLITGTIFFVGTSYWVTYSMHNYGGMPIWLCYLAGIPLAAILAIFTGLFSGILSRAIGKFGGWAILLAPPLWAAMEWCRVKTTGMGWDDLGYSQAFTPNVIQL